MKAVQQQKRRSVNPKWLGWVGGLLILGMVTAYLFLNPSSSVSPLLSPAPDFTLQDLEGNEVSLSDFIGKPVLINFWASWCQPCVEELPALEKLWQTYEGDVVVLAINQGESTQKIQAFLSEHDVSFPVLVDQSEDVNRLYRVRGLPQSYFIDAQGNVEHKLQGFIKLEGVPENESLLEYYKNKSLWGY